MSQCGLSNVELKHDGIDDFREPRTGTKGSAWVAPSSQRDSALSIQGKSEACAAWARMADPSEVTALFAVISKP